MSNRVYLVYRPTGDAVLLGERGPWGWAAPGSGDLDYQIQKLFNKARKDATEGTQCSQDDFVLAMEQGANQPGVISDWRYSEEPGRLEIGETVPFGSDEVI